MLNQDKAMPKLLMPSFLIFVLGTSQTAFGGLMFLSLPEGRNVEILYAGDIAGEIQVQQSATDFFGQPDPRLASATAFAVNTVVFQAYAAIETRFIDDPDNAGRVLVGRASARATATGGEVIVMDLRTFEGDLPSVLQGDFFMDGFLSFQVGDIATPGHAGVDWRIGGLSVVNEGRFQQAIGTTISNSVSDLEFVNTGHSALLAVTYRWLLPDGSATSDEQIGRRPDFGVVAYEESLSVFANGAFNATATADFSGTAKLTSVLFADGSTPESHGIDLYFLSGRTSPNLDAAAVPEPASLTLWGLAAIGCAVGAYRRRRETGERA